MIIPNASKEIQLFWKEKKNHWPWWIIANIIENMIMILKFESLKKKKKKKDVQGFRD